MIPAEKCVPVMSVNLPVEIQFQRHEIALLEVFAVSSLIIPVLTDN